jgi:GT2 family glycosyltransferase
MLASLFRREPTFSVVVCSIDKTKFERVSENYRQLFGPRNIEIIGIHDARSLAEGYNRGIARARAEFLILSHDDIRILSPDFAARVRSHLDRFDLVGVAGTKRILGGAWFLAGYPDNFQLVISPSPIPEKLCLYVQGDGDLVVPGIQALDGLFLATRTEIARKVGLDAVTFDHFHLYDLDFTFAAFLAGYRLAVCRDLLIVHESHGSFNEVWLTYKKRFEEKYAEHLGDNASASNGARVGTVLIPSDVLYDRAAAALLSTTESLTRFVKETEHRPEPRS